MSRWARLQNIALQEAMKSECNYKHGAIITKNGKILARGCNTHRTKFLDKLDYCQHAEMAAITRFISNTVKKKESKFRFLRTQ